MTLPSFLKLSGFLLAQTAELDEVLGEVAGIVSKLSMLFFFFAIIVAAVMITTGRTEYVKHIFIGVLIGGAAWLLVNAIFGAAGITTGIELP